MLEELSEKNRQNAKLAADIKLCRRDRPGAQPVGRLNSEKAEMSNQLKSYAKVNEAVVNMCVQHPAAAELAGRLLETRQRAGQTDILPPGSVAALRQRQAELASHSPAKPFRPGVAGTESARDVRPAAGRTSSTSGSKRRCLLDGVREPRGIGYEKKLKKALSEREKTWKVQIALLEHRVEELSERAAAVQLLSCCLQRRSSKVLMTPCQVCGLRSRMQRRRRQSSVRCWSLLTMFYSTGRHR